MFGQNIVFKCAFAKISLKRPAAIRRHKSIATSAPVQQRTRNTEKILLILGINVRDLKFIPIDAGL